MTDSKSTYSSIESHLFKHGVRPDFLREYKPGHYRAIYEYEPEIFEAEDIVTSDQLWEAGFEVLSWYVQHAKIEVEFRRREEVE